MSSLWSPRNLIDEIEPVLALVEILCSLPPIRTRAKLNEALETIQQPPPAQPVAALPEMAGVISGKTYRFEPNPTHIKSVRFDFDNSEEAGIEMLFDHTEESTLVRSAWMECSA
jgi:hypothetical protein